MADAVSSEDRRSQGLLKPSEILTREQARTAGPFGNMDFAGVEAVFLGVLVRYLVEHGDEWDAVLGCDLFDAPACSNDWESDEEIDFMDYDEARAAGIHTFTWGLHPDSSEFIWSAYNLRDAMVTKECVQLLHRYPLDLYAD